MSKILIVNWQDLKNPLSGGAERHLHEIFKRLSSDYEITLFASSFKGGSPQEDLDGMRVIRRGKRNDFNFVFAKNFIGWLRYEPFDMIIEDLNKIPFFTPLYSPLPKIAIVHHFFGGVIYRETNPLFATYVYTTERLVGRFYQDVQFISVSESTKQDLIRYAIRPEKITVIYNGVDTDFYHPVAEKSHKPLVISVGRIKRYKAIDQLLFAMKKIVKTMPELKLIIVGDGDDRIRLEDITSNLGLERNIQFTGWVSEEEKRRLISTAWFGVTTSEKEGFGLVNVEIQACGTPVVSANSPGLRESVIHAETGLLYRFGDIEDLVGKMRSMVENQKLRRFLTSNARNFATRFSWDRSAEMTRQVINQTLTRCQNR
ncbi:MAG TPA: glycosyltransferase family 1 protein [bacterium (Candidatus Stahlbacteria)]|nr:glycosyltransferase family 1 protein [Candidatus Stahlbacteria bacterium]